MEFTNLLIRSFLDYLLKNNRGEYWSDQFTMTITLWVVFVVWLLSY